MVVGLPGVTVRQVVGQWVWVWVISLGIFEEVRRSVFVVPYQNVFFYPILRAVDWAAVVDDQHNLESRPPLPSNFPSCKAPFGAPLRQRFSSS